MSVHAEMPESCAIRSKDGFREIEKAYEFSKV